MHSPPEIFGAFHVRRKRDFPKVGRSERLEALCRLATSFRWTTTPSPCQPTPERERQLRRQHRGLVTPQIERKYGGLAALGISESEAGEKRYSK